MTQKLYRQDAYLKTNTSGVTSSIDNIITLESSIFYPLGGGQPGDIGTLSWDGHEAEVINTTINAAGEIQHILS